MSPSLQLQARSGSGGGPHPFARAEVRPHPFPHFFLQGVFRDYPAVVRNLPPLADYEPFDVDPKVFGDYGDGSAETGRGKRSRDRARRFLHWPRGFWADLLARWSTPGFLAAVLDLFRDHGSGRFGPDDVQAEMVLVKYLEGYSLGPHTDLPDRVVSIVVYLPASDAWRDYGISLCVPEDGRVAPEGRHQGWRGFRVVERYPYLPNSAFGFVRTDSSFHGVEPVGPFERDALVYYLKRRR